MKNRFLLILIVFLCSFNISGCYRPDVQQGNFITPDNIRAIQAGMTPQQVQEILGTPVLNHPFFSGQFYYVYTFAKGYGKMHLTRLFIYFYNSRVTHVWTDLPPDAVPVNANTAHH